MKSDNNSDMEWNECNDNSEYRTGMTRQKAGDGRVLLLRWDQKVLTLLYAGNRLIQADACLPDDNVLDQIYIGKVKNVAGNIQAAFVEYMPGKLCFLPLRGSEPVITNRKYDGRILAGDEIVLQICAESQKQKEARATTSLSFSGSCVTLVYGRNQLTYAADLPEKQRKNLKAYAGQSALITEIRKEYGIHFDAASKTLTDLSELEKELLRLKEEADQLRQTMYHRTCFSLLYKAPSAWLKCLKSYDSGDYEKILTDDVSILEETKAYLERYQPADLSKLVFYEDPLLSLSKLYSVETRLTEALERKVWLKSGGYLVIERTEAFTCVDVNSGKYIGKKGKEETFLHINLEAAQEIGRQLRLRNISGIIIIDFINMERFEFNKTLMKKLKEIVGMDPVPTTVVDMTPLGLVEVTRKKGKRSLWEQLNRKTEKTS